MAGDWIKFEHATIDKPEVLRGAEMLGIDRDQMLGLLVRYWIWLDKNLSASCPDSVRHMSAKNLDESMQCPGFAATLVDVGWAKFDETTWLLHVSNAQRHNGKSAKSRALDAVRKRLARLENVRKVSGKRPGKVRLREEKKLNTKPSPDPLPNGTPSKDASATEGQKSSRVLNNNANRPAETRKATDPWPRRIPEIADQHGLDLCARAYGIDVRRKHFASYAELQSACFDARNQLTEKRERETATGATDEPRH